MHQILCNLEISWRCASSQAAVPEEAQSTSRGHVHLYGVQASPEEGEEGQEGLLEIFVSLGLSGYLRTTDVVPKAQCLWGFGLKVISAHKKHGGTGVASALDFV